MDPDETVIQECLEGKKEAFEFLVRKYQESMLRTAYHYLGTWDEANDAVQETFIKVYRSLHSHRSGLPVYGWLFRILINTCKDRLKSAHRRYRRALDPEKEEYLSGDPLDRLAEKELIQKTLSRLPSRRRQAMILVDILGFSGSEAAAILGCSESTLRVTSMRAREQMKKIYLELSET